jgi:hypothetical protein
MPERTPEDRLREEYFDLLPEIRRVAENLEAQVRYHILPIKRDLHRFEQITVKCRIKEGDSAVDSLRRRQEGRIFDLQRPQSYSLLGLKDLAGVRVLAFPALVGLKSTKYSAANLLDGIAIPSTMILRRRWDTSTRASLTR